MASSVSDVAETQLVFKEQAMHDVAQRLFGIVLCFLNKTLF